MNCRTHFNGTHFSKPNLSELVHFASEAVIVSKPIVIALQWLTAYVHEKQVNEES